MSNKKHTRDTDKLSVSNKPGVIKKLKLASKYQQAGELHKAVEICNEILSVEPNNANANHILAIVLIEAGNYKAAFQLCNKATKESPNQADMHNTLGCALEHLNQIDAAIACYRFAISIDPYYAYSYNNLGNALRKIGRFDEAINNYEKTLSIMPEYAESYNNLGNVYKELGQIDKAVSAYKKSLSINPGFAKAYMNLSGAVKNIGHDVMHAMEDLYVSENISDKDRTYLSFALGKSYEDTKKYDESFNYYMEGNRLERETFSYSSRDDYNLFEKIKEVFSKEYFSLNEGAGDQDEAPIFIVGMPRSGTSLVEQILASHPLVFGAGELDDITHISQNCFSTEVAGVFPENISEFDKSHYKKAGLYYIDKIRMLSDLEKYIVDKMPHNFLFVGLIKSILPNAKVIYCKRDPMDNCFSIYKNFFAVRGSHKYAYEMGELGRYYTLYLDLIDHWRNVLPDFGYEIQYEELIKDQKNQTRKLLDYCDLPWDDVCLEFYKTKRSVVTASNVQVRKPIYTDSVRLWERYERQLEPLRQAIYGD